MEFTTASKVAIGTLVLGVAGYLGKEYLIGYKISDLIKQHNPERKLISSTTSIYSEKWKDSWKKYLNDNKDSNPWNIPASDWNIKLASSKIESVPTSFVDACDEFSERSVVGPSNSLYQEVLKWCTSSSHEKISELIKERGKRLIKQEDAKDSEARKALLAYLKVSGNPLGIEGIEGIDKDLENKDLSKSKQAFDAFVKKCYELGEKSEEVTDDDIVRVSTHCTVTRTIKDLINEEQPNRRFVDSSKIKDTSSAATELWTSYFNKNKDKEQDDWNVGGWNEKRKKQDLPPKDFFKKCDEKSGVVALNFEKKIIKELVSYCTFGKEIDPAEYKEKEPQPPARK